MSLLLIYRWLTLSAILLRMTFCQGKDLDSISRILDNIELVDPAFYVPEGFTFVTEKPDLETNRKSYDNLKTEFEDVVNGNLGESTVATITTSTTSTTTSTTTTTTTTTTTLPHPPGTCYSDEEVCNVAGSLVVTSGLIWTEELLHPASRIYKTAVNSFEEELRRNFEVVQLGSNVKFLDVEAFSRSGGGVFVDIYLQLGDLTSDITTDDIMEAFAEVLNNGDNNLKIMGEYGINIDTSYFIVVDSLSSANIVSELSDPSDSEMPEWAILVIVGGSLSLIIIGAAGWFNGLQRWMERKRMLAESRIENNTTRADMLRDLFQSFREQEDEDCVDNTVNKTVNNTVNTFKKRKANENVWTLQKKKEMKRSSTTIYKNQSGQGLGGVMEVPAHHSRVNLLEQDEGNLSDISSVINEQDLGYL